MKFQKLICLLALLLVAAAMLAGCMNGGNVGVVPEPTADFMPRGTQDSMNNASTENAAVENNVVPFDWTKNATRIEGQINRISEIAESRVVVADDTALVGVKFDSAYKGEMTERIREMVASEVMTADPRITTVAVTAYGDDVEKVFELSDRVTAGRKLDELRQEINEIVRNATTLR